MRCHTFKDKQTSPVFETTNTSACWSIISSRWSVIRNEAKGLQILRRKLWQFQWRVEDRDSLLTCRNSRCPEDLRDLFIFACQV